MVGCRVVGGMLGMRGPGELRTEAGGAPVRSCSSSGKWARQCGRRSSCTPSSACWQRSSRQRSRRRRRGTGLQRTGLPERRPRHRWARSAACCWHAACSLSPLVPGVLPGAWWNPAEQRVQQRAQEEAASAEQHSQATSRSGDASLPALSHLMCVQHVLCRHPAEPAAACAEVRRQARPCSCPARHGKKRWHRPGPGNRWAAHIHALGSRCRCPAHLPARSGQGSPAVGSHTPACAPEVPAPAVQGLRRACPRLPGGRTQGAQAWPALALAAPRQPRPTRCRRR